MSFIYGEDDWRAVRAVTPPLPDEFNQHPFDEARFKHVLELEANDFLWQQAFASGLEKRRSRDFDRLKERADIKADGEEEREVVNLIWKVRQEQQHEHAARDVYISGLLHLWRDVLGRPITTTTDPQTGEARGPLIVWLVAVVAPVMRTAGVPMPSAGALRKVVHRIRKDKGFV